MSGAARKAGVVLIGRNEGDRLIRALDAVCGRGRPVVYVDSGSTDGSVEAARARGARVIELDMSVPFTAARARNAGFEDLIAAFGDLAYVQFVDGDCEVVADWLDLAESLLDARPELAAVCGYRRERHPERTVFNRVCDVEWRHGPAGFIACFGGDVMIRVDSLRSIRGYDPTLIAGEDEEVGIRLRKVTGLKLLRVDRTCTLHDADMHSVRQWWRRAKRCGHAYAQLYTLHGAPPEAKCRAEVRRSILWGAVVPAAAIALTLPSLGLSHLLWAAYPLRAVRTGRRAHADGFSTADSVAWGISCTASALPEALGVAKFHWDRWRGNTHRLIEYKAQGARSA